MSLRIALANHDEVVVLGVTYALARYGRDMELVELRATGAAPVDLVLHDPASGVPGPHAVMDRLVADPQVGRIVAFTWSVESYAAGWLSAHGYDACLSIRLPGVTLVDSLCAVHRGRPVHESPHGPTGTGSAQPGFAWPESDFPGQEAGLTAREADVLSLISSGLSNREISTQLNLSINSVKTYIRGAYRTIGVDSRTKAVLWSIMHGLRTPTAPPDDAGSRARGAAPPRIP
ncbi:helix-turn-helix transcriptional regulator [Nocardioides hwasunensis]|uniref:Response regulator transcription factor n=1 Tax=Nocardioides hwasunensis TaxID=397258 RepID=A0ABR8MFI4_9ACTN|nr:response regulator transcription factor [Nocardioides hwasunensis]MBD3914844.1 response regulator transcription factor [Nocardioides hwasunensis]